MTRRVAILGLGARGARWAEGLHQSGWVVSGFDPDPMAGSELEKLGDWKRQQTISSTVRGVDWVVCCLPDRLELMQMVLQRVQAEAPEKAIVTVASRSFDIEDVQASAIRPGLVFRVTEASEGSLSLDASDRNSDDARALASDGLAELAAVWSLKPVVEMDHERGAESA